MIMASVTGRVVFDRDRSASVSAQDTGIANIPVVLQEVSTGLRLTVLTDANGNYSFINVPDGQYRIVESYGQMGGVASPGDFEEAETGPVPLGVNPPVSSVNAPPPGTTNLDSVTPDTVFITVSGENVTGQNFLNGPVIYTPIEALVDDCAFLSGENLINAADNGTFGAFPQGTPANTGAPEEPYPGVTPDYTYVLPNPDVFAPLGGEYTVQNIMNNSMSAQIGAWWRIADHTTGNETGRMMIVNGYNPGTVFFRDVVTVQPNTNYLFTAWILNLFKALGYPNPELGVRILDAQGEVLYSADLGILIPVNTNAPEWKQIGTVVNSRNNTSLTVEFLSQGPETIGNDYAIDDVSFNEIQIREFTPVKTADVSSVGIGEVVEYTVTLTDTCTNPLTDVFFRDIVPNGFSFVPGSVVINGTLYPAANPNAGFALPDIPGGGTAVVRFQARADFVPAINPAINRASMMYSYTPVEGGIPAVFEVDSNDVPVLVAGALADLSVMKRADAGQVRPDGLLTYTITVRNAGPSAAENVVLTDIVPSVLTGAQYSVNGGAFQPWTGSLSLGTLAEGGARTVLLRGTLAEGAQGTVANTASVSSSTPDPNPDNNSFTVSTLIITAGCQAYVDLIQSIALQEAALAGILNAEGAKMQRFIGTEGVTNAQLFGLNQSVTRLIGAVSRLEIMLQAKLQNAASQLEDCAGDAAQDL